MKPHGAARPQRQRRSGQGKPDSKPDLRLVRPDDSGSHNPPDALTIGSNVRPDLTSQVEPFIAIAHELPPLFERHHRELFDLGHTATLDPDWYQYFSLEAAGKLRVRTARSGPVLAGYIINVVSNHVFSKRFKFSCIEKFYLDIPYRGSGFAVRWFGDNDADLKANGVKAVCVAEKLNQEKSTGVLFKRLGYRPIETVWLREL